MMSPLRTFARHLRDAPGSRVQVDSVRLRQQLDLIRVSDQCIPHMAGDCDEFSVYALLSRAVRRGARRADSGGGLVRVFEFFFQWNGVEYQTRENLIRTDVCRVDRSRACDRFSDWTSCQGRMKRSLWSLRKHSDACR